MKGGFIPISIFWFLSHLVYRLHGFDLCLLVSLKYVWDEVSFYFRNVELNIKRIDFFIPGHVES